MPWWAYIIAGIVFLVVASLQTLFIFWVMFKHFVMIPRDEYKDDPEDEDDVDVGVNNLETRMAKLQSMRFAPLARVQRESNGHFAVVKKVHKR